jgi:hypothetical protein
MKNCLILPPVYNLPEVGREILDPRFREDDKGEEILYRANARNDPNF